MIRKKSLTKSSRSQASRSSSNRKSASPRSPQSSASKGTSSKPHTLNSRSSRSQSQSKGVKQSQISIRSRTLNVYRNKSKKVNPFHELKKSNFRHRPGQFALKEISYYQSEKGVGTMIPKQCFKRLLKEVSNQHEENFRWTTDALYVIQSACEEYLTGMFEGAMMCADHAGRICIMSKDMALVRKIRGLKLISDPNSSFF